MSERICCANCAFSDEPFHDESSHEHKAGLICRRNAPEPLLRVRRTEKQVHVQWPEVRPDDWCGEFKLR
ncbi:MAG TPA: hypothetical protein PKH07_20810 [bacterium]|nr:hypothetical protein [bacterium]